jgi:hypothetical protein
MRFWLVVGAVLWALQVTAGDIPAALQGVWKIEVEASVREFANHPQFASAPAEEIERLPEMVGKMREMLTLYLSDERMTMVRGKKKREAALKLTQVGEKVWVFQASRLGKTVELTFVEREPGLLLFQSEATKDLNYYLWRRVPPEQLDPRAVKPEEAEPDER